MRTYQLRSKSIKLIGDNKKISFPNLVELEISLEPKTIFGAANDEANPNLIDSSPITNISTNMGTGKSTLIYPSFSPVEIDLKISDLEIEIQGNKLRAKRKCKNFKEISYLMYKLHYIIPSLLTIELVDAPIVKLSKGKIGDVPFVWSLEKVSFNYNITNKERQEKLISDSLNRINLICDPANKRLEAALCFYHRSKRLMTTGNSPYEFLSEIILNYSKVLEALFVNSKNSMDDVRNELPTFGYDDDEINLKFIPIMILRNHFDVAHVTTITLKQEQLNVLHEYLTYSESDIRELLKRVIIKTLDGSYTIKKHNSEPTKEKDKRLRKLIDTCKKRI